MDKREKILNVLGFVILFVTASLLSLFVYWCVHTYVESNEIPDPNREQNYKILKPDPEF